MLTANAETYYLTGNQYASGSYIPCRQANIWTNALGETYTIQYSSSGIAGYDPNTFVVGGGYTFGTQIQSGARSFDGDTLVIDDGALFQNKCLTYTVKNLRFTNGGKMSFNGGSTPSGRMSLYGDGIYVDSTDHEFFYYQDGKASGVDIYAPISGDGTIYLHKAQNNKTHGYMKLMGDNSGFKGRLKIGAVDDQYYLRVSMDDNPNNIGGNPDELLYNGVELGTTAQLNFSEVSYVVDQPNRGLYVGSNIGRKRIIVSLGHEIEWTGPWSFGGTSYELRIGMNDLGGRLYLSGGRCPRENCHTGWFWVDGCILKMPAQHVTTEDTSPRFKGSIGGLEFGSNGVARVNPTYFTYSGTLSIVDTATLEVTSSYGPSTATNITMASGTTLSMTGTAAVALNNVTLEDGATLAYHFSSTNTTSVPVLSINSGKELSLPETGNIKVRITADEGLYFESVGNSETGYELTTGCSLPYDAVTSGKIQFADGKPSWARCLAIEGGNLKLYPYGPGFLLSVR